MSYSPRRILMIGPLPPPVHGSSMMTEYLRDSEMLGNEFRMSWVNLSTSRSMSEIGQGGLRKIMRFAGSYFRTLRLLMTHRYTAAYIAITCRGVGFLKDAPFALLCKMFKVPIVLHQHNKGMDKYVDRKIYRKLLPVVYRGAKVVLLSPNLYPDISRIVDKENVEYCPNGIPDIGYKEKKQSERARILFLSNLMLDKGVKHLLDTLRMLHEEGHDFECVFVGGETSDMDATGMRREIEIRGLNHKVRYLGRKYGKEKDTIFSNTDILVLPTLDDCFPLVLLEGMMHGVACVATRVGGIPDIITDGEEGYTIPAFAGREVNRDDIENLAKPLRTLITDSALRKEMGRNGRKKYEKSYTLSSFENRMLQILRT